MICQFLTLTLLDGLSGENLHAARACTLGCQDVVSYVSLLWQMVAMYWKTYLNKIVRSTRLYEVRRIRLGRERTEHKLAACTTHDEEL